MANWQGLEKRSAYALTKEEPVQDGGIYRIAHCWRKPGTQKFLVCRYLFVRCDKEPAPCSTEDVGSLVHDALLSGNIKRYHFESLLSPLRVSLRGQRYHSLSLSLLLSTRLHD
ncbi:hypothetical protein WJX79_004500 [Trebouxia sp. C0005]